MVQERIAVYPGSFDPVHNGHIHTLERALELFDRVHVVIASNADKTPFLTPVERVDVFRWFDEFRCKGAGMGGGKFPLLTVTVLPPREFTVTYAHRVGARYIVRGLRNGSDLQYEQTLQHANAKLCGQFGIPEPETWYVSPPLNDELYTSSSLIRGFIGMERWEDAIMPFVPGPTLQFLRRRFGRADTTAVR
ncbi:MAG TPA: pantetheine-phosphate adenylyltransferase [Candidatus Paceibacterota bacterium]|nr:pantetheine-phosphate adenylyltransferase [Candidatus Paceibacterota bacterium]